MGAADKQMHPCEGCHHGSAMLGSLCPDPQGPTDHNWASPRQSPSGPTSIQQSSSQPVCVCGTCAHAWASVRLHKRLTPQTHVSRSSSMKHAIIQVTETTGEHRLHLPRHVGCPPGLFLPLPLRTPGTPPCPAHHGPPVVSFGSSSRAIPGSPGSMDVASEDPLEPPPACTRLSFHPSTPPHGSLG